jgi:hypothetical protein
MQLVTRVDIRDVHFEDRSIEDSQNIVHRNRGEGVRRRIDDQYISVGARAGPSASVLAV